MNIIFQYAVKFVCGKLDVEILTPGQYWTAINVHNSRGMRLRYLVIVTCLLGLAALADGTAAQTAPGNEIMSLATGKCLDVAHGSTASGSDVNQYGCHLGDNQRWFLEGTPLVGYVHIRNEKSGLCLDVRIGGPDDGGLQQFTCHGGDNQLFRLERMSDQLGGYRLVVRHSGKCLDVPGGQGVDGGRIQQWPCHTGINQRWMHAFSGPYRYPLVVDPIGRYAFWLDAERTYIFEFDQLPPGGAPVLHLWHRNFDVAFNSGPATPDKSILSYTVPVGRSGLYRLFAFSRPWTVGGTGRLTVYEDGSLMRRMNTARFGGTVLDVPHSSSGRPLDYEVTLGAGGPTDTYTLALDHSQRIVAVDDSSGVGRASRIAARNDVARIVVGSDDGATGLVTLYANDAFRDLDGDGLGYGLERELGTCDVRGLWSYCAEVHNLQDSDRDGLTDAAETFGIDGPHPMHLARWGASPVHKDIFIEVDYTTLYSSMPMTEADAEAIRDYFLPGRADDLANPDGWRGVRVHLDLGFNPLKVANRTLFGDWGGSNKIPQEDPDKASHRRAERDDVFFHAILHTGGQGVSSDAFGFSLLSGSPRNRVRTFIHELGHVLDLQHEGGSDAQRLGLNCSSVYPSIMSYAGQFASGPFGDVGFASGTEYPGLSVNPAHLCEAAGMGGGDVSQLASFGIPTQGSAVDWNRDGTIESCSRPVRARVNWYPPQGCDTFIQGHHARTAPSGARGGSPSLARLGGRLYLFYVDENGGLRYISGRMGTTWPESGCPRGFSGGTDGNAVCTDWSQATSTPEARSVRSVRAIAADGRMYVAYTVPEADAIQALIATSVSVDGTLGGWLPIRTIPQSESVEAPALGLLYHTNFRGDPIRLLVALWPDKHSGRVEGAHLNLASLPTSFFKRAPEQDGHGQPISTNGAPLTLAFWGHDDGHGPELNQSWLALADEQSRIRIYVYDPAYQRWADTTASVFPVRPTGEVSKRIGFAFSPLLDSNGQPLDDPLKGEFTLVYGADNEGGVATIWISDVVDTARPPHQQLRFPTALVGRFGHPWYGVSLQNQAGFELYADPGFPYLKGAVVRADHNIAFLAYADGVFDLEFRSGSDFQVMERGICLRLRDGDAAFCGPPNRFGY